MLRRSGIGLILFVNALTFPARADYGWIPDYEKLIFKAGADYYRSVANFDTAGTITSPILNNEPVSLTDFRLWAEPEYGIAEDWSVLARLSFISSLVDSDNTGETLLTGYGLGDLKASLKYALKTSMPILTLEARLKVPTSGAPATTNDEVVIGDGNFDAALIVHTGHRSGRFLFSLSPGLLVRSGGYSSAVIADIAGQLNFAKGYIRLFTSGIISFTATPLFDSALGKHDALGSGGSFAKLNGSPVGISGGGLLGFRLSKQWAAEGTITAGIFGTRYPSFFELTLNAVATFDFYKPETKKKMREIPLDSQDEKFYQ